MSDWIWSRLHWNLRWNLPFGASMALRRSKKSLKLAPANIKEPLGLLGILSGIKHTSDTGWITVTLSCAGLWLPLQDQHPDPNIKQLRISRQWNWTAVKKKSCQKILKKGCWLVTWSYQTGADWASGGGGAAGWSNVDLRYTWPGSW